MGLRHITLPESLYGENIVLANCVADDPALPSYIPDDYTAQYESTQHLLAAGYRQPYASGYRKVRWQQGIVGRDLSRPGVMLDEIWLR
ncbi:csc operon repressor [Escherichia coli]|uniref:Csc operon repressor n=1 Tax=Escherichia coli TaxID=562 RepID=A0A377A557_ECOLX|nr:csc operon repressor [Escherichia coli]